MNPQAPARILLGKIARISASLSPWAIALYLHYWLESEQIWAIDMPLRPPVSAALLAIGLALSLVVHSTLSKRRG